MKIKLFYFIFLFTMFFRSVNGQNWTLVHNYDFHASDQTNHDNIWHIGLPWWDQDACGQWHSPQTGMAHMNLELQAYNLTPVSGGLNNNIQYANVTTPSGTYDCLRLIATKGLNYPYSNCSTGVQYDYKSGMIRSMVEYLYGKFEIRCKLPNQRALWPAFWLLNMDHGEIDIMEVTNKSTSGSAPPMSNVIHSWGGHTPPWDDGIDFQPNVDLSADFHLYSLEWTPFYLKFFIDNNVTWMLSRNGQDYFPTGSMELLINLAINHNPSPDLIADNQMSANPSQVSLDIDYIKIYEEMCSSYVLCDADPQNSINYSYNVDLAIPSDVNYDGISENNSGGHNLTCLKTVNTTDPLSVTASNIITMHPGFSADAQGSNGVIYLAQIANCNVNPKQNMASSIQDEMNIIETEISISIYPNPTEGNFIISTGVSDNYLVKITSLMGDEVKSIKFFGKSYDCNLSDLSKGMYFIEMIKNDERNSKTVKVIIN